MSPAIPSRSTATHSRLPEATDTAPYLTHVVTHHGQLTLIPPENAGRMRKAKTRKAAARPRSEYSENDVHTVLSAASTRLSQCQAENVSADPIPRPGTRTSDDRRRFRQLYDSIAIPDSPPPSFLEAISTAPSFQPFSACNDCSTPVLSPTYTPMQSMYSLANTLHMTHPSCPVPDLPRSSSPHPHMDAPPESLDRASYASSIETLTLNASQTRWDEDRLLGLNLQQRVNRELERQVATEVESGSPITHSPPLTPVRRYGHFDGTLDSPVMRGPTPESPTSPTSPSDEAAETRGIANSSVSNLFLRRRLKPKKISSPPESPHEQRPLTSPSSFSLSVFIPTRPSTPGPSSRGRSQSPTLTVKSFPLSRARKRSIASLQIFSSLKGKEPEHGHSEDPSETLDSWEIVDDERTPSPELDLCMEFPSPSEYRHHPAALHSPSTTSFPSPSEYRHHLNTSSTSSVPSSGFSKLKRVLTSVGSASNLKDRTSSKCDDIQSPALPHTGQPLSMRDRPAPPPPVPDTPRRRRPPPPPPLKSATLSKSLATPIPPSLSPTSPSSTTPTNSLPIQNRPRRAKPPPPPPPPRGMLRGAPSLSPNHDTVETTRTPNPRESPLVAERARLTERTSAQQPSDSSHDLNAINPRAGRLRIPDASGTEIYMPVNPVSFRHHETTPEPTEKVSLNTDGGQFRDAPTLETSTSVPSSMVTPLSPMSPTTPTRIGRHHYPGRPLPSPPPSHSPTRSRPQIDARTCAGKDEACAERFGNNGRSRENGVYAYACTDVPNIPQHSLRAQGEASNHPTISTRNVANASSSSLTVNEWPGEPPRADRPSSPDHSPNSPISPRSLSPNRYPPHTDLDALLSRIENDNNRDGADYEALLLVSDLVGPASPRRTTHPSHSQKDNSPVVGRIDVQRRRVTKDGRVKLKLTLADIQVDRCGVCLSQFKEAEWAAMGVDCRHAFHEKCLRHWLVRSQTCPLCRVSLSIHRT